MAYVIGVFTAAVVWALARISRIDRERSFYPVVLSVVASYYVLFAAIGGSVRFAAIEVLFMTPFVLAAGLGYKRSLWIVVAGLAAHGLQDAFHVGVIPNPGVPVWWPAFCLAYDVTAAVMLARLIPRIGR